MARTEIITVAKKAADVWMGTDTYYQAAQIIDMLVSELEGEPTLTPLNELLTCDGCIHEKKEHQNCNYCMRASYLSDYYYRHPPEGQEDYHG